MEDKEAQELLKKLSEHYGEPVMPVSKYCSALRTWAKCITQAYIEDGANRNSRYNDVVPHLEVLELVISKSSLLDRLIYVGEELRTERCPVHKGVWSGLPFPDNDCEHGCDLTGWIRNGFVKPKPGDPCTHKWMTKRIDKENNLIITNCYHCHELIESKPINK